MKYAMFTALLLLLLCGCGEGKQIGTTWEEDAHDAKFYRFKIVDGKKYQIQMGFRGDGFVVWRPREMKEEGI